MCYHLKGSFNIEKQCCLKGALCMVPLLMMSLGVTASLFGSSILGQHIPIFLNHSVKQSSLYMRQWEVTFDEAPGHGIKIAKVTATRQMMHRFIK